MKYEILQIIMELEKIQDRDGKLAFVEYYYNFNSTGKNVLWDFI